MVENKRCILIAEDEPKMVRALRDFFKASGFYVLEARDGVEALDVFCENSNVIDIILLDVMMLCTPPSAQGPWRSGYADQISQFAWDTSS